MFEDLVELYYYTIKVIKMNILFTTYKQCLASNVKTGLDFVYYK